MDHRELLRRLTMGDASMLETELSNPSTNQAISGLDPKSGAFARLGASVAIGANSSGYQEPVEAALAAGASVSEIIGALLAVGPLVGTARVISAAPALGLTLGYDLEASLEFLDPDET